MHIVDLSSLTPAQGDDFQDRYQSNLRLFSVSEAEAVKGNGGLIARIAASVALDDVRNRRQRVARHRS